MKKEYTIKSSKALLMIATIIILFMCNKSFAQPFPQPIPVNPALEKNLLGELKSSKTDKERIPLLLKLSNLCYNKPFRIVRNLDLGIYFAQKAISLSNKEHNISGYNEGQLLNAYLLMDKDSMKAASKIIPLVNDTTRVNILMALSYNLLFEVKANTNENAKWALMLTAQARPLIAKFHQKDKEILTMVYNCMSHVSLSEPKLAKLDIDSAFKASSIINYPKMQYIYFAMAYLNFGSDAKETLDASLKALKSAKATNEKGFLGEIYYILGVVFQQNGKADLALENYELAVSICKLYRTDILVTNTICKIADLYVSLRQYEKALSYLNENYNKYPNSSYDDRLSMTASFADCYLKLKRYTLAEKYFLKEYKIQEQANLLDFKSYERLAYFYIEAKQYAKARPYLVLSLKSMKDVSYSNKAHLHYMFFLADSASGNYISAINHLNQNRAFYDSAQRKMKVEATQKLLISYETDKKNQEIRLLQEKGKVQTANLRTASLVKNITNIGVFVLLLALGLFYWLYRRKQRDSLIISSKNLQLGKLLNEKEWLLKEVHHRVKNNLHTVCSLLGIQSEFLKDDALKAVENTQHRIYAMSLIHQKLYMSDVVKTINMADYLPELTHYLKDSFGDKQRIKYELNIQSVHLDVGRAVPLGLMINEAVTNSIKYAFPNKKEGVISINMTEVDSVITLIIADNGTGFIKKSETDQYQSLGLKLIMGLSQDIDADTTIDSENGTRICISFKSGMMNETIPNELSAR